MTPTPAQTRAFYHAAAIGLRALEAQENGGRRFGPEADARWSRFRGALHDGDRFEMLLRDAAVTWGPAFAAARVFDLPGVATDEPFGPAWKTPSDRQGTEFLAVSDEPGLAACAAAQGVQPVPVDLPPIRPGTRLVLAGASAVLAAAEAFVGRGDLDWAEQVTVVADEPAVRQLSGLASLFVGAVRPCALRKSEGFEVPEGAVVVASSDADPASAAALGR